MQCLCRTDTTTHEPLVDKVISAVKGGTPDSAAAMKSQLSKTGILDKSAYVEWARTLIDKPALIQSDVNTHSLMLKHSCASIKLYNL